MKKQKLYYGKYYIIIAIRDKDNIRINDVDNILKRLNDLGCNINRVSGIDNIRLVLYECINK